MVINRIHAVPAGSMATRSVVRDVMSRALAKSPATTPRTNAIVIFV